jgi:hypothetical protein
VSAPKSMAPLRIKQSLDGVLSKVDGVAQQVKEKNLDRWLPGYLRHVAESTVRRVTTPVTGVRHLLFAVCDHYEPLWGKADDATGLERVKAWAERYPAMANAFRDADGKPPQHSFFFPGEEYRPQYFDQLETLIRGGFGEVELHLHHHNATEASLRAELKDYLEWFAARGHFSRGEQGQVRYAFIHGDWALANARPDGHNCGVDNELQVLWETGCYADFTFPSIPNVSQPHVVNQVHWPVGDVSRRRAYEWSEPAEVGKSYDDRILMIQGPAAVGLKAKGAGVRLEYSALMSGDPPTEARVHRWVRQNIHVLGRPDWVFVKTHTHGAPEDEADMLLGGGSIEMHRALQQHYNDGVRWKLHYVTAREMYNIAKAAMAGCMGDPNQFRDFELPPPPIRAEA